MSIVALIMCAGSSERWKNYQGVPKQLLQFGGETLLNRTVRLLRSQGVGDPIVVAVSPKLRVPGVRSFTPARNTFIVDSVASTSALWAARTIILLGDVFYTTTAIRRFVNTTDAFKVFGRPWPSMYSGCTHGELFGLSFASAFHDTLLTHLAYVSEHGSMGGRGNLWNLYQSIMRFPYNSKLYDRRVLDIIDDFTDDFDRPHEYDRAADQYEAYALAGPCRRLVSIIGRHVVNPLPLVWFRRRKFMLEPVP